MGADQTEPEEVPADAVGRRVSCRGERATVRFVGPVPPTEGKTEVSDFTDLVPLTGCQ